MEETILRVRMVGYRVMVLPVEYKKGVDLFQCFFVSLHPWEHTHTVYPCHTP